MSMINAETLEYLKRQRVKAKETSDWECGYQLAIRGLDSAIALLEQIGHTTKGMIIETKIQFDNNVAPPPKNR